MAYTLIASTSKGLGSTGGSSDPIDTSGANLIILWITWINSVRDPDDPTDNKGNTPYLSVVSNTSVVGYAGRMWLFANPAVGSNHIFSSVQALGSVFNSIGVLAFSGGAAPAESTVIGSTGSATSLQASGPVTPVTADALVLSGFMQGGGLEDANVDSGFTEQISLIGTVTYTPNFLAYKIQSGAPGAENPTWSWTTSLPALVANAVFPGSPTSTALPFLGSTLSQRA